jgi:hypothetical protein
MSDHRGASPVIFGERGDSTLLGAVTLEALGVILDPIGASASVIQDRHASARVVPTSVSAAAGARQDARCGVQ